MLKSLMMSGAAEEEDEEKEEEEKGEHEEYEDNETTSKTHGSKKRGHEEEEEEKEKNEKVDMHPEKRMKAAYMAFEEERMAEMKKERKVVIGEYDRNEANPTHYLWKGLREHCYGDQAYRKNPLGERDVILSATQETMRRFKKRSAVASLRM